MFQSHSINNTLERLWRWTVEDRALVEPQAPKEGPQVIDKRPWCLVNPIDIAYVCELLFLFLLKSYHTTVPWIRLVPLHVHPLRDFDWMQQRYICLTGSQTCNFNRLRALRRECNNQSLAQWCGNSKKSKWTSWGWNQTTSKGWMHCWHHVHEQEATIRLKILWLRR